jgi:dihydroxyacetone kinase-like protein
MLELVDRWLLLAAERIHAQAETLTLLDQAIGDGDHGVNMDRGFRAIVALVEAGPPEGDGVEAASGRLRDAGRTLISRVGGASGPLYGSGLLRAAAALHPSEAGASGAELMVLALEAAGEGISALGRSSTGEKTMLDALVPGATAARGALDSGMDKPGIAAAAAEAAEAGAQATIPMLATKGRASYLGERSVGHQDPGATSAALLLRALADSLSS